MIINGKEYKFLYTVGASIKIAEHLPGHKINAIAEVFQKGDQIESMKLIAHMAMCMNEAYLRKKALENETKFNPEDVIKKETIDGLTMFEENELENEIVEAYTGGNKTTIETEPIKGKNKGKKTVKE